MSYFGIDYAWTHPQIQAMKAAGVKFSARYLSHDSAKNLSAREAQQLTAAGIDIVVVWESTASRSLGGYYAGVADAHDALAEAAACGMPSGRPIYFAVDFDASQAQMHTVMAYLDGAAKYLGVGRVGIYGGYYPVHAAFSGGHVAYGWQTYAWSGGQWDARAQLQQYSNGRRVGGVDCDYNRGVKDDYGQWRVGGTSTPTPTPPPTPTPTLSEDDEMFGPVEQTGQTPISFPRGKYHAIGFGADTGHLAADPAGKTPVAKLRVAIQHAPGKYSVEHIEVDGTVGKTVVHFPDQAATDFVSVEREDDGAVRIAWDMS